MTRAIMIVVSWLHHAQRQPEDQARRTSEPRFLNGLAASYHSSCGNRRP